MTSPTIRPVAVAKSAGLKRCRKAARSATLRLHGIIEAASVRICRPPRGVAHAEDHNAVAIDAIADGVGVGRYQLA
ncbi:MAG TPA: hypothetical protein VND95_02345, partial [Stellaceae bacterium]|nr:hypothetical protein [Stellaceae bacterium]